MQIQPGIFGGSYPSPQQHTIYHPQQGMMPQQGLYAPSMMGSYPRPHPIYEPQMRFKPQPQLTEKDLKRMREERDLKRMREEQEKKRMRGVQELHRKEEERLQSEAEFSHKRTIDLQTQKELQQKTVRTMRENVSQQAHLLQQKQEEQDIMQEQLRQILHTLQLKQNDSQNVKKQLQEQENILKVQENDLDDLQCSLQSEQNHHQQLCLDHKLEQHKLTNDTIKQQLRSANFKLSLREINACLEKNDLLQLLADSRAKYLESIDDFIREDLQKAAAAEQERILHKELENAKAAELNAKLYKKQIDAMQRWDYALGQGVWRDEDANAKLSCTRLELELSIAEMWEHLRTKPEELKKAITKQWKCKAFKHHADKNVLETDSEQQRHADLYREYYEDRENLMMYFGLE